MRSLILFCLSLTVSAAPLFLLAMAAEGSAHGQNKASGTLTIGKDKFDIHYAAATLAPDPFDKKQTVTRIVLTDKPVPEYMLDDDSQISDLKKQGCHGIRIDISADKENFSGSPISSTLEGTLSMSGTFDAKQLTVFTATRVEGQLEAPASDHAGTMLGYSIKFAAAVAPREGPPTPADAAAASSNEAAKAYLSLAEAIRTGNKQKILEMAPPDRRAMIDTPQFPEMLKMVQMMQPQNIHVLKAKEYGDHARILVSGTQDGQPQRGRIYLDRVNGKWIMAVESWGSE